MEAYKSMINSGVFYMMTAGVLLFITVMCFVFLVKSYRAGIKLGMDKAVLRKTIISSATFTLLPSISILLGVIALSGTLGVPFSWLRLSVIGALQYELNVAEIAATSIKGITEFKMDQMTVDAFVTVALVMTVCIMGGPVLNTFFLKGYLKKVQKAPKQEGKGKPGFGAHATTAMFIGLCSAYIGSYIGKAVVGSVDNGRDWMPLFVALFAAAIMAIFEFFIQKKGKAVLENFSLAASMLIAMAGAVAISSAPQWWPVFVEFVKGIWG